MQQTLQFSVGIGSCGRWFVAVLLLGCLGLSNARATGFADWATTPPMGWNSWDAYGQSVTESEFRANADYMAANLKQYGWEYAVIDIRWTAQNPTYIYNPDANLTLDANGRFLPAPNRFPSAAGGQGFKPLADYLHSQGLKFGIHIMRGIPKAAYDTDPGTLPNGYPIAGSSYYTRDVPLSDNGSTWLPDMYGIQQSAAGQAYYNSLFQQYASWGVDYVKVDDMFGNVYHGGEVEMIRNAIDASGRPIVFSVSPGLPFQPAVASSVSQNSNLWRISGDLWDSWPDVYYHFDQFNWWNQYRSTGKWPDGDMLPLGRIAIRSQVGTDRMSTLSHNEQRTLMSLWSIARSPLMFGGDLPSNDTWTTSLISNQEVLNVNQRSTNNHQLFRVGEKTAWLADAPGGGKYLALFNSNSTDQKNYIKSNADFTSSIITRNTPGQSVSFNVDITGQSHLYLLADDGGDNYAADWSDWVNMQLRGPGGTIPLTSLPWVQATAGYGSAAVGHNIVGNPLNINGTTYADGIGTHAISIIEYELPSGYSSLTGIAGLDQGGASQTQLNPSIQFFIAATNGAAVPISVTLADLGFTGSVNIRDLWSHSNLGTFTGSFTSDIPDHGAGMYRLVSVPTLPGDYNGDNVVDDSDYIVWRKTFGSSEFLAADGNGNFVIDDGDYQVWKSHFGQTSGRGSVLAAVPEPGAGLAMVLSLVPLITHRRRSAAAAI
jgi:alpha-galactosidase